MSEHVHSTSETSCSGASQFCECGAVRMRRSDLKFYDADWHICDLCRPPGDRSARQTSTEGTRL